LVLGYLPFGLELNVVRAKITSFAHQGGPAGSCLGPRLVAKKFCIVPVTSNLAAHAWSIKCRRKKLIAQLGEKLRNETFEPN